MVQNYPAFEWTFTNLAKSLSVMGDFKREFEEFMCKL